METTIKEDFHKRTSDDKIKIIDVSQTFEEVTNDCYGSDWYELTEEELKALNTGKVLLLSENGGEYQMFFKKK